MSKINDILRTGVLADITANKLTESKEIKNQENQIFLQYEKLYESNVKKKKKLLNVYARDYKKTMPKKHKWVFTFYVISIILLLTIIISTIACLFLINNTFDKVFAISMICFFGIALYCLPYFTYKMSLNSQAFEDFYYLKNEKILLNKNGFNYYYYDIRYNYIEEIAMFKFSINYKDIKYVRYDKRVNELFIYGDINVYEYKDNKWQVIKYANEKDNNTQTGVLIQNIYEIDLLKILKENDVVIEEYNYIDRRKKEEQAKKGKYLVMEDIGSLIIALAIIYSAIIILTILLLNKIYKAELVLGTKTKEITRTGTHNYLDGDAPIFITSYFSFKTKKGKEIIRSTSNFSNTKKGKKKYFFYSNDKDEIVGKIYTLVWESFFFMINMLYSLMAGVPFFIIAILIVLLTIWLYSKYYKKKYKKGVKYE